MSYQELQGRALPGEQSKELLELISTWGPLTTIVFSGGSVFEFKGAFPKGTIAEGFYNFGHGSKDGFQGHLNLDKVGSIAFQNKLHRGKQSYAFVFQGNSGECIFKVFLGRDERGEVFEDQLASFNKLQQKVLTEEGRS